ncbi:hypothetical protein LCGC14_1294480, partial [marine sediment metagenome]
LRYQTMSNLKKSIGKNENQLCLACLTGEYPIKFANALPEIGASISESRK